MTQRHGREYAPFLTALCGTLIVLLAACGAQSQIDPPGQNSGSPQNAAGVFNFDTSHLGVGAVGTPIAVYDAFTTVTTNFTITNVTTLTATANQNVGTIAIPAGYQFLRIDVNLTNTSASATGCGNPKAEVAVGNCTEYLSPLANFRLMDDQLRQWPTTTGAAEKCSDTAHAAADNIDCSMRQWLQLLNPGDRGIPQGGLTPGMSFNGTLYFLVPLSVHNYSLFFAPYRFTAVAAAPPTTNTTPTTKTLVPTATATSIAPTPTNPATGATNAITAGTAPYTVVDIGFSI